MRLRAPTGSQSSSPTPTPSSTRDVRSARRDSGRTPYRTPAFARNVGENLSHKTPPGHDTSVNTARSLPDDVVARDRASVDDDSLLSAFLKDHDEGAFRALAARHAGWLYAAAFRQLGDRHAAEDATQAVFILLWRQARRVAGRRKLSGWLFNALGYTVRAMKRTERRRRTHESRAVLFVNRTDAGAPPPPPLSADIDAAVAALGDADRTAILLRFHRGLEFDAVARELGVSSAAARQRVSRAVKRLRTKLSGEFGPAGLASAVAFGAHPHPTALIDRAANAAISNARGSALAGGVQTALKGAVHLMAMTRLITGAAFVALATVLATSAAAVIAWHRDDDTSARVYALGQGDAIRQVLSVPQPERIEFMRLHGLTGDQIDDHPESAMIVRWKDGRAALWGRKSSTQGWYTVGDLVGHFVRARPWEFEGEPALKNLRLRGDFAVDRAATTEQYRSGIEKIASAELGKKAVLAFREVERPVVVFRGQWRHKPAGTGAEPATDMPTLDLYGKSLAPLPGSEASCTLPEIAVAASDYVGQQILFECQGAPERISVRSSHPVPTDPAKALPAADAPLVLRRIEEQTGLKATREKRKVRRLFITFE